MSMNLVFKYKLDKRRFVEFPFQTTSECTRQVLAEKSSEQRLSILKKFMQSYGWPKSLVRKYLLEIKENMEDETLELTYI